ncbi:MAG: toll/interleukin-1 receptor domain-containing protein [Acidimicrobiia bacterium]|nr:toll/interleukin-1 receptor domain-containing protein [Acidimicrobiia bacterium]
MTGESGLELFLSYSSRDAKDASTVRSVLASAGHDIWVDSADIQVGDQWRARIVAGLEQADAMVVLLSRHSIESDDVLTEVQIARDQGQRILPLRLDGTELQGGMLYALTGFQTIDLPSDRDRGFQVTRQRDGCPSFTGIPGYRIADGELAIVGVEAAFTTSAEPLAGPLAETRVPVSGETDPRFGSGYSLRFELPTSLRVSPERFETFIVELPTTLRSVETAPTEPGETPVETSLTSEETIEFEPDDDSLSWWRSQPARATAQPASAVSSCPPQQHGWPSNTQVDRY